MEFVIAFIFMSVGIILTIMAKLSEKVKNIVMDVIQKCNSNCDNEPMCYVIIDTYIPKTKKIEDIEIFSPEGEKKYLYVGTQHNLEVALVEHFGETYNAILKPFNHNTYNDIKCYLEYVDKIKTTKNLSDTLELKIKKQKQSKKRPNSELIVRKREVDRDFDYYISFAKYKWEKFASIYEVNHHIQKNLSDTKPDTKRKNIAINNSTKEQHCKDNYEENQQEKYYCERCFKEISYEEYELYDFMCEDCFEEVDLDIYKRKK